MDAREVAEAIREALASKGQATDVVIVNGVAEFSLATAVAGFEGVKEFGITVEEREGSASDD